MIWQKYPWLSKPYEQLVTPILQKRAHHALLLRYVLGSGENVLIKRLIKRLLCQQSNQYEPCQNCHSCQLFESENHPDFYLITNENDKKSIGVDQIRTVLTKVNEKSQQGGNKIVWIKSASLMTEAASNALLKTLEEPTEQTYFILSDDHNNQLLPTVYSRCFSYFLSAPVIDVSIQWLKTQYQNYNDNELTAALLLNENAPIAAYQMLEPKKWQHRKQFCADLFNIIPDNDYWSLANKLDVEQAIDYINWFCALLNDTLKVRQKAERFIVNRDQLPLIKLFERYKETQIMALYEIWLLGREQLLTVMGLNKELIMLNLFSQSELLMMNKHSS